MVSLLLSSQFTRTKRFFRTRRLAKLITVALFCLVFALFSIGVYLFFLKGFGYLQNDDYFFRATSLYVYEIFFLLIFILIAASTAITALFRLFKNKEDGWLMASPCYRDLSKAIFWQSAIATAWPIIFVVLPALVALGQRGIITLSGLFFSFLAIIFFALFTTALIFIVILFAGLILSKLEKNYKIVSASFSKLILFIIILFVIYLGAIWAASSHTDLVDIFHAAEFNGPSAGTELIAARFHLLPSHLIASQMLAWQLRDAGSAFFYFFLLGLLTLFSVIIYYLLTDSILPLWQLFQEEHRGGGAGWRAKPHWLNFKFRHGQLATIFSKELIFSLRNSRNLLWLLFLALIWLLQTGLNLILARNVSKHNLAGLTVPTLVQVLQFVTSIYFLAALALRFVLPSFSAEKKTAWIFESAPLLPGKIFIAKFSFFLALLALLGLSIGYSNTAFFENRLFASLSTFFTFFSAIFFLVTLALSLGFLYPNHETSDPSIISTSLPGLIFIFTSLAYGALGGWLLYGLLKADQLLPLSLFLFSSFIFSIFLIVFVQRRKIKPGGEPVTL
jgi:hypothetical protein